jgi:hypothetical protein
VYLSSGSWGTLLAEVGRLRRFRSVVRSAQRVDRGASGGSSLPGVSSPGEVLELGSFVGCWGGMWADKGFSIACLLGLSFFKSKFIFRTAHTRREHAYYRRGHVYTMSFRRGGCGLVADVYHCRQLPLTFSCDQLRVINPLANPNKVVYKWGCWTGVGRDWH